jgi:hypothetical protein
MTRAPSPTSRTTVAWPMPDPAPVTIAVLPSYLVLFMALS